MIGNCILRLAISIDTLSVSTMPAFFVRHSVRVVCAGLQNNHTLSILSGKKMEDVAFCVLEDGLPFSEKVNLPPNSHPPNCQKLANSSITKRLLCTLHNHVLQRGSFKNT
jgi:hypothetical protein